MTPQVVALRRRLILTLATSQRVEIPMHSTFCGAAATGKLFNRAINQSARWQP